MKFYEAILKAKKNEVVSKSICQQRVFKYDYHDVIHMSLHSGKYVSGHWREYGLDRLTPYDILKCDGWAIFPEDAFEKKG